MLALRSSRRGLPVERAEIELTGPTGTHTGAVQLQASGASVELAGELTVPGAELWWPHTHGRPALYEAALVLRARRAALHAAGRTDRLPHGGRGR